MQSNTATEMRQRKLKEEIDSWHNFSDALRLEDRELFRNMTAKLMDDYADAIENSQDEDITEALLISLLISQQKTINFLLAQRESSKKDAKP